MCSLSNSTRKPMFHIALSDREAGGIAMKDALRVAMDQAATSVTADHNKKPPQRPEPDQRPRPPTPSRA
jgi:hypothetical protein